MGAGQSYLDIIRFVSSHFDEEVALTGIADAHNVFNPAKGNKGNGGTGSSNGSNNNNGSRSGESVTGSSSGSKRRGGSRGGSQSASSRGETGASKVAKSREHATQQTLAAWLNFAKGAIDWTEMVDTDGDNVPDTAFGDLIGEVESILNNQDATKDDLERAKDLAEAVNKHDKNNPDCDTGTGTGTRSRTGGGTRQSTGGGTKVGSSEGSKQGSGTGAGKPKKPKK